MFYSGNDNYMQDLYYYNQVPNNTYNNSFFPYADSNLANNYMQNNMNSYCSRNSNMSGMYMGCNCSMQMQNLNNLYPSIYRIILPVAQRVISNGNYQYMNEDTLNNMVDTVYNIVDGQIDYDDDNTSVQRSTQAESTVTSNTTTSNSALNTSNQSSRTTDSRQVTNSQTSNSGNNRHNSLLRDIIKIIILRELLSRNQNNRNMSNRL